MIMNLKENSCFYRILSLITLKFSQGIVYICVPLLTLFNKLKKTEKKEIFFDESRKEQKSISNN